MRDAIGTWQRDAVAGRAALRAIDRGALHVTLCFLGARASDQLGPIGAACDTVAGMAVGGLALGPSVWLPRKRPGVLAATVEDDRGELRSLQSVLAGALATAGQYSSREQVFFPHVTVARARGGERIRRWQLGGPAAVEFRGSTVVLYRSHLGAGPATYEGVHTVQLAAESSDTP